MDADGIHLRERCRDSRADVGFVASRRIGDSLVSMVIVENLRRAGRSVVVWGDHLHALRRWFPETDIRPLPAAKDLEASWRRHDLLLHFRPVDVRPGTRDVHDAVLVLDDLPEHRGPLVDMVTLHEQVSRSVFGVQDADRGTGLRRPTDGSIERDADPARIMIHPTASKPGRQWHAARFVEVARRLADRGWHPEFVTHPSELEATAWIEDAGLVRFSTGDLDALATRLAGAAGFLGNDSGVGHLASCIGLPWVSLFIRRKVSIRWRPGWTPGEAIRPVWPLVFKPLKERFWASAIPVGTVMSALDRVMGASPADAVSRRSRPPSP